ncbi:RpiB/LacA/LacB family sugar-phosphate isomerase [Candidatus Gottesmanbacteria bacterium]|nr:RpiB/LacA/LacB family sugar-phosphate isomerase [Candidatus Gottesmanbacteria bacterium]
MILVAADKHGFKTIQYVGEYLNEHGIDFVNLGVKGESEDVKLEDVIPQVAKKVRESEDNKAILSCGTGVGVAVGANKFRGIRACLATTPQIAEWSVVYDNCNVLCLSGWEADKATVYNILDAWFHATYDGDKERLKMIAAFDTWR